MHDSISRNRLFGIMLAAVSNAEIGRNYHLCMGVIGLPNDLNRNGLEKRNLPTEASRAGTPGSRVRTFWKRKFAGRDWKHKPAGAAKLCFQFELRQSQRRE